MMQRRGMHAPCRRTLFPSSVQQLLRGSVPLWGMASFYDEVEIEDMVFDEARAAYFYPCPCGDKFVITLVR